MLSNNIVSAIDGKTYNRVNGHFTRHIRHHGMTYQEYYETYITGRKEFCACGKPRKLQQKNHEYTATCGSKVCHGKLLSKMKLSWSQERNEEINARRRATSREKYGVDFVGQDSAVKAKIAESNKRIVDNSGLTSKELQQKKARKTKIERYGDEFYNNNEQISKSKQRHDVERKNEITELRRATCMKKYGVPNHLMRPEMKSKNASANASLKTAILPSGKEISYQGFEFLAIKHLLSSGYEEDDFLLSNPHSRSLNAIPFFEYLNLNNSRLRYYPDIFIPSENRIIEVKSRWWYDANGRAGYESRIENNRRKAEAAKAAGYHFEFWVFNSPNDFEVIS